MNLLNRFLAACGAYFQPTPPSYQVYGTTALVVVAIMLITLELSHHLASLFPKGPMQATLAIPARWPALATEILHASDESPLVKLREELSEPSRREMLRSTDPDADGRAALRLAYQDWQSHHSTDELDAMVGDVVRFAPGDKPIYLMFIAGKIVTVLLILRYLRWSEGITLKDLGLTWRKFKRSLVPALVSLAVWFPFVIAINAACQAWMPGKLHSAFSLVEEGSIFSLLLVFLAAAVVAPIVEELIFRGVILTWLMQMLGTWPGIVATSLLFGFTHMPEWPAPIPLSVLGIGMALAFLLRRSLWTSILFHTAFNGINLLFAWAHFHFTDGA